MSSGTKVNLFQTDEDDSPVIKKNRRKISDRRSTASGQRNQSGMGGKGKMGSGNIPGNPQ
jgi:hypothetical protein